MRNAIILEEPDIKRILSIHFSVPEKDIMRTKYSYVVTNTENTDLIGFKDFNANNAAEG